jgi:hypothetical protein
MTTYDYAPVLFQRFVEQRLKCQFTTHFTCFTSTNVQIMTTYDYTLALFQRFVELALASSASMSAIVLFH